MKGRIYAIFVMQKERKELEALSDLTRSQDGLVEEASGERRKRTGWVPPPPPVTLVASHYHQLHSQLLLTLSGVRWWVGISLRCKEFLDNFSLQWIVSIHCHKLNNHQGTHLGIRCETYHSKSEKVRKQNLSNHISPIPKKKHISPIPTLNWGWNSKLLGSKIKDLEDFWISEFLYWHLKFIFV